MWFWRAGLLTSFVALAMLAPNVYSQLSMDYSSNSDVFAEDQSLDDASLIAQPGENSTGQQESNSDNGSQQSQSQESGEGQGSGGENSNDGDDSNGTQSNDEDSAESSNTDSSSPAESETFSDDELQQVVLQQPNEDGDSDSKFTLTDNNLKLGTASLATSFIASSVGLAFLLEGVKISILLALFGPLLAKRHSDESGTLTKGRILGYIEAHPAIHFSALRDGLSLANGATSHHLYNLEKEGKIISWTDGRRTRYAIPNIDPTTLNTLKHPATAVQKSILNALENNCDQGLSSSELRKRLECTRQLLAYHLGSLAGRQFIERNGKGRKTVWLISIKGQQHIEILQNPD